MRTQHHGRHEFGQNFLTDRSTISTFVDLVGRTHGPIVEIGTGDGALTLPLERLGRRLTGIEIDHRRAERLRRRTSPSTSIVTTDFLRFRSPAAPHVLVGNLPFHETTPMLRRILRSSAWTDAVLLVQWEVARRRAGVGGATLMTAQWWPWYEFGLEGRVPATAFRPRPNVDGGLLTITRRRRPLVAGARREEYQEFVRRVFTGRGRGLPQIVASAAPDLPRRRIQEWVRRGGGGTARLPKDLGAGEWAELFGMRVGGGQG
ncbi:23S ribosomal RNA methyltransferase Erm [Streptomyces lasiicapitis]|uniref:23S ribosomal RNA methyltransferase Erm n=1 Tax=Streptomyces lasiicapitis TaxID=1923961 RepID=UPI003654388D